jgi:hypothetical protein
MGNGRLIPRIHPPMTELRNRVVLVRRFGDPDGLEVADAPLPTVGWGEVRVRVLASGVEYTDVVIRRHLYPQTMLRRPPFVMGYDVVGEIDQLGEGVSAFQVGDRVADMTVVGSNAAYRTLQADQLARVPPGRRCGRGGRADLELDDRLPAPSPYGLRAAKPAGARTGSRRGRRPGAARARQDGRARALGHSP